jgi:hypothetical protein
VRTATHGVVHCEKRKSGTYLNLNQQPQLGYTWLTLLLSGPRFRQCGVCWMDRRRKKKWVSVTVYKKAWFGRKWSTFDSCHATVLDQTLMAAQREPILWAAIRVWSETVTRRNVEALIKTAERDPITRETMGKSGRGFSGVAVRWQRDHFQSFPGRSSLAA